MKIAVIGTRGIPARYGGFESCVEETVRRWTALGHDVVVYVRSRQHPPTHAGARLVYLPSIPLKGVETLTHTLLSVLHLLVHRPDVVHLYGLPNIFSAFLLQVFSMPTVLTADGLDWKRPKWNRLGRAYHRLTEALLRHSRACVAVDSRSVRDYYRRKLGRSFAYVPYGAEIREPVPFSFPGLQRGGYLLFVGRLVPDKNIHTLISAYVRSGIDKALVIVGDDKHEIGYRRRLEALAAGREDIHFLGYVYGDDVIALYQNAYVYVQPSELEGTSPALLTGMANSPCVIVNGIEENLESAGDGALVFHSEDDLVTLLRNLDDEVVAQCGERARRRIAQCYQWDGVAADYLALLERTAGSGG